MRIFTRSRLRPGNSSGSTKPGDKILGGANHAKAPDGKGECILIGSYDFSLHCIEAATGKVIWKAATDNFINGSPAVLPTGEVAFGGCDSLVHVVKISDGKEARQIETEAYIASSIAVKDGIGYVGNYGNVVVAMDLRGGETKWKFHDKDFPYFSSAAVTADRVLIGGRDKRLHCLERATGKPAWEFQTRGHVDSSPVVCGDAVIFGSLDGRLYCVELADGKQRWAYDIGAPITGSPAAADGDDRGGGGGRKCVCVREDSLSMTSSQDLRILFTSAVRILFQIRSYTTHRQPTLDNFFLDTLDGMNYQFPRSNFRVGRN